MVSHFEKVRKELSECKVLLQLAINNDNKSPFPPFVCSYSGEVKAVRLLNLQTGERNRRLPLALSSPRFYGILGPVA